ncbi:hypothetical protein ACLBPT_26875, partial [Klebsiella pneumoniae]
EPEQDYIVQVIHRWLVLNTINTMLISNVLTTQICDSIPHLAVSNVWLLNRNSAWADKRYK